MANESYLKRFMPFENSVIEDQYLPSYKNKWKSYGNCVIKDSSSITDINGNKLFHKALYINNSNSSYIYQNDLLALGYSQPNFSISFYLCVEKASYNDNTICPIISNLGDYNHAHIIAISRFSNYYKFCCFYNGETPTYSDRSIIQIGSLQYNIWYKICLIYYGNNSTLDESNKIEYYIDDNLIETEYNIKGKLAVFYYSSHSIFNRGYIGNNCGGSSSEYNLKYYGKVTNLGLFTGYLKNLKIYNGLAYQEPSVIPFEYAPIKYSTDILYITHNISNIQTIKSDTTRTLNYNNNILYSGYVFQ